VLAIGFGLLAVCFIGGRVLGLMPAFVLGFLPLCRDRGRGSSMIECDHDW
jgi:hypothetical protein